MVIVMAELRWNPLIKDWVIIAPKRQARPEISKEQCPFCVSSGKVPKNYDVYSFENDFPALSQKNPYIPIPFGDVHEVYRSKDAYGKCEVILYSPEHTKSLCQLSVEHLVKVVELWIKRFEALKADERIKYIYIFENRGELAGATISHPHGQIYGYSYIPKRAMMEIESCEEYYQIEHTCLICDMLQNELKYRDRIIIENDSFAAFVPFFSECPYGVYIVSRNHKKNLEQFNDQERIDLASMIKNITGSFDKLFNYPFPYMMCMHQGPVNSGDLGVSSHFHIEFYSPMRSERSQKYNAAGETGAWAHINPTNPEEKAWELRMAYLHYKEIEEGGNLCDKG
jgi:UDPglucose--hexose-1-phosphate uridylyltransferase